jgi:hypothetical protein
MLTTRPPKPLDAVLRLPEENVDNNLAFSQLMFITQHASAVAVLLVQRFSNFFQVGTTFISQNVLRTTLLLSP